MPMSRRKDRLIFRSPSPGISRIPESTSPPSPPRIQRTRPIELPSRSTVTNLNERLASALSANSSTTPSLCSPIGQSQHAPSRSSSSPSSQGHVSSTSPTSSKSSKSSSPPSVTNSPSSPRRLYESWLYHLYDRTDANRATTNQTLSGWDILRASSDTSDTSSQNSYQYLPATSPSHRTSPPHQTSPSSSPSKITQQHHTKSITNTPSTSPHRRSSQSSQQYASNTTSPSSSNTPASSPRRRSTSATSSSQPPRKMHTGQAKRKVGADRKYSTPKRHTPVSPHRHRPANSMIRPPQYSGSTVESDTSEEEPIDSTTPRPLWMSRLRPRRNNSSSNNNSNSNNGNSNSNSLVGKNIRTGGKSNARKSSTTPNNNNKNNRNNSRMETNNKISSLPLVKRQLRSTRKMKSKKNGI